MSVGNSKIEKTEFSLLRNKGHIFEILNYVIQQFCLNIQYLHHFLSNG